MHPILLSAESFDDTHLLRFPRLAAFDRLVHVVTMKPWNMAPHRGPQREMAVERRRRICVHLGVPFERLTAPDQIHSHHVLRVEPRDVGAGRDGRDTAIHFVDGLFCSMPETPLIQMSGDCTLILLYDAARHVIGTAHASWRGTVAGVATQLVVRMAAECGCRSADMWAGLAPCAGVERYEVGEDVRRVVRSLLPEADRFLPVRDGRIHFDLKAANHDQLVRAGVHESRIEVAAECTLSDERFYSHRREGQNTGRFALIAALRP